MGHPYEFTIVLDFLLLGWRGVVFVELVFLDSFLLVLLNNKVSTV